MDSEETTAPEAIATIPVENEAENIPQSEIASPIGEDLREEPAVPSSDNKIEEDEWDFVSPPATEAQDTQPEKTLLDIEKPPDANENSFIEEVRTGKSFSRPIKKGQGSINCYYF